MLTSAIGDDLASMALDLHAAAIGSAGLLASLLVAQSAPAIILGLAGGLLADTVMRWWVWPISLLIQGLVFAALSRASSPIALVAGVAVVSTVAALTGPVANKLLAHYTDDAARSGGHLATVMGLSQAIGVAAGGAGFAAIGASALLVLDATTFIVFAALACLVATREAVELDASARSSGVFTGFRRLSSESVFGLTGLGVVVATIMGTSIEGVVGIFVMTKHALYSSATVGVVVAAWGLGVMAGATLVSRLRVLERPHAGMSAAALAMGSAYMTMAVLLPPAWLAVVLFAVGGIANGVFNALLVALIMGGVSGSEQGRAWAAWRWITAVCFLAGYLIGGFFGASHAVVAMCSSGAVAAAAGAVGLARAAIRGTDRAAAP